MEQVKALVLDIMNVFHVLNQFISLQTNNQYEQVAPSVVISEET